MTLQLTFDPQIKLVLDSISPDGIRLPTVQFRQPRMIHADFLTHRVFSRNGRSSRAVPAITLLEEARFPYVPHFLKNKPGMSASEEFTDLEFAEIEGVWRDMAEYTRLGVMKLNELGLHKQWANRPLEWFGYIDVLLSANDWDNYLELRDHEAAQPEIQQIARAIKEVLDQSEPQILRHGEWHLPYIEEGDWDLAYTYLQKDRKFRSLPSDAEILDLLKKISAARCARLTIKPFDGDGSFDKELQRYAMLIESRPVHASPVEHQATPDTKSFQRTQKEVNGAWQTVSEGWEFDNKELHGNFTGWIQNRKTVPYEAVTPSWAA
ncbi:FAD-dependent thymidylate synthase [Pararhizobium qamdonense]|uniref:FAD-dependent thymidylate synthase n=1 Tax=Pararhizobium qamdonense TaxID=3031126 RepID=UPI0023E1E170|nr:FAD-dependent thymidylate synthase [Pararhizobium qamdonense]